MHRDPATGGVHPCSNLGQRLRAVVDGEPPLAVEEVPDHLHPAAGVGQLVLRGGDQSGIVDLAG